MPVRLAGILGALAIGAATWLAGCNMLAPAAYLIGGPPSRDAVCDLDDRPTLVFVDDRGNAVGTNGINVRAAIAERVSQDLMKKKLLTTTINPRDAIALASSRDRHEDLLSMDELGRVVGAEVLIYIEMVGFRGTTDGVTPQPNASCNVRVIDVVNQVRLFPPPDDNQPSRPVSVTMPTVSPDSYRTRATQLKIQSALAEELGTEIGKLFYKHEINELGQNLR